MRAFDRQPDGQTDRQTDKGLGNTVHCITCTCTVKIERGQYVDGTPVRRLFMALQTYDVTA